MAMAAQELTADPRTVQVTVANRYVARFDRVIDGDTVVVYLVLRHGGAEPSLRRRSIRLRDVKAPELRDPGGPEARDALDTWCRVHSSTDGWLRVVSYIEGGRGADPMADEAVSFGRLVGDVQDLLTGAEAGKHMVDAGKSRALPLGATINRQAMA
jgi:hypothetical protein